MRITAKSTWASPATPSAAPRQGFLAMPKSILIEPEKVFAPSAIRFTDIPVNAHTGNLADHTPEDLLHIYQDMCAIREFETILNEIKTKGAYKGIAYNH